MNFGSQTYQNGMDILVDTGMAEKIMEFRQLSYFVAVVDTGSISAASRQVHIAQPALTRQIRLLEEDLGTRLLERHPRGVSPTVAGKALYSEAMQLLDTRSRMRTKLS